MKIVIIRARGAAVAWRSPKPLTGVRILPGLQLYFYMNVLKRGRVAQKRATGTNQRVDGASPSPSTHVDFLIIIKVDLNYYWF